MPKIVLHYLDGIQGTTFGECIRHLLRVVNYEEKRYTLETWAEFKPKTPFGQLPVLEIDDKQYAQSIAICRYLGEKYGYAGKNAEEDFEIDQNVDFVKDIYTKATATHCDWSEVAKQENIKNVHDLLQKLNTIIQQNSGVLVLPGRLTWGDFLFADMFDSMKLKMQSPNLEDKYPAIKNLHYQIGFIHVSEEESE